MSVKGHPEVPKDFPVKVLKPGEPAKDRATCGTCGRSWDDAIGTEWTPAPGGRCPFEYFHADPDDTKDAKWAPKPGQSFSLGTVLTTRVKDPGVLVVLVLKFDGKQFVTGKVTAESSRFNEWSDGHYFDLKNFEQAHADFLNR